VFEFIESAAFDRIRAHYLDDDEYGELQQFMLRNPEAGDVALVPVAYANFAGAARVPASGADCE
jgi:hypothetical protein